MEFEIKKYKLRIIYTTIPDARGSFNAEQNTIFICKGYNIAETKITIAHELAHFFYQYELDNHIDRLERRFNTDDMADLGSKISEMIAHIVGHYGEEIQKLTKGIMYNLAYFSNRKEV